MESGHGAGQLIANNQKVSKQTPLRYPAEQLYHPQAHSGNDYQR